MAPKYLHHLANLADSTELWEQPPGTPRSMAEQAQLDAGIALRRYADHLQTLAVALGRRQSVLITPLSANSTAVRHVPTPPDPEKLRPEADSDTMAGLRRYLNDVLREGTVNEKIVARTALRMIAQPPSPSDARS